MPVSASSQEPHRVRAVQAMVEDRFSRRALVVSCGPPLSLKVLYCLAACGIRADLLDIGQPSMARGSRYCQRYERVRHGRDDPAGGEFLEVLNQRVTDWGSDIIVPADIGATGAIHEIRSGIRRAAVFPVSSPEVLDELDNKARCHAYLRRNAIDTPKGILVTDTDGAQQVLDEGLQPPWLIKPLFAESGHGISKAEGIADLRQQLEESRYLDDGGVLIQEYVAGVDADISVLAMEGEVIAHVVQVRRNNGRIEFIDDERIRDIAIRIVRACSFTGVINIDVRINEQDGRVTVIECNPRFWYTLQASMWRGLNFVEAGVACAVSDRRQHRVLEDGVYYYHGEIVRRLLWRPWRWSEVPGYNWRGFWQALSDPLPFVITRTDRLPWFGR